MNEQIELIMATRVTHMFDFATMPIRKAVLSLWTAMTLLLSQV